MLFWHLSLPGAQLCGGQGSYKNRNRKEDYPNETQHHHPSVQPGRCRCSGCELHRPDRLRQQRIFCCFQHRFHRCIRCFTAASAAAAGDNSCGEGVTWTLADGTLTISGTGRMTNFTSDSPAPWADQADQITNVEVEGTVTSIGAVAFKGCTNLTTVNIADGVEYIEAGAFNGCTALTDITIPESVGYIKTGAFKDCSALTSVTIRDNCRLDMNVFPTTVEVNHSEG